MADPRKAREDLERKALELEEELKRLIASYDSKEIGEKEYSARRKKLEREYVEVMDRIVQLRFIEGAR